MVTQKEYAVYFLLAVVFGAVLSFGLAAMFHQPMALTVQLDTYAPTAAPTAAIPTVAVMQTPNGAFTPAPAPVVVTTEPLPTITPEPTEETDHCAGDVNGSYSELGIAIPCAAQQTMAVAAGIFMIFVIPAIAGVAFLISVVIVKMIEILMKPVFSDSPKRRR